MFLAWMTEVVVFKCKSCGAQFGPLGMHGYSPREGNGEMPVVCKKCKTMNVGKFLEGELSKPNCPKCNGIFTLFDGHCPACGGQSMVYEDMRLQGFERDAVPSKK